MIWIETHYVFGVTSKYYLKRSPQELAKDKGNSSFIQPIKLDDMIALAYKFDDDGLAIKNAICKKYKKKKPKGKEESTGGNKLRVILPINITLVPLPRSMVRLFFPQLEHERARLYKAAYSLATDVLTMRGIWNLSDI